MEISLKLNKRDLPLQEKKKPRLNRRGYYEQTLTQLIILIPFSFSGLTFHLQRKHMLHISFLNINKKSDVK